MVGHPSPEQLREDDITNSLHGCGSHDEWLQALERCIDRLPVVCPCCTANELRLHAALTQPAVSRATISFWCDRCLWGLMPNAVASERVVTFIRDELAATPPDYRIVQP